MTRWSNKEEEKLEENWKEHTIRDLVDMLDGRSYDAIRKKARRMDLSKKQNLRKDDEAWSDEEENFLHNNWEEMTNDKLSDELNRSSSAIITKAKRMKLPEKPSKLELLWDEEEESFVEENYKELPLSNIAEELGKSEKEIQDKAEELGLMKFSEDSLGTDDGEFSVISKEIDVESDEMIIAPIGDIHLGHPKCKEEMLFDKLDYLEEMDNPYRIILMGDIWEGATKNSPNFQFDMKYPPQKQYQNALAIFEDYSDKILGAVVGNHESFATNITGQEKMRDFCRELNVPFLGYKGVVNAIVNGIYYRIVATHGNAGGKLWGSRINSMYRLNNVFPDADLYLYGHTHTQGTVTDSKYQSMGRGSNKKKRTYVLTGSYLDYPGSYADKKNYPPTWLGTPEIVLDTNEKSLRALI